MLRRRTFTADEFEQMAEAGLLGERESEWWDVVWRAA